MLEQRVTDIIRKPLNDLGYEVVQVRWQANGKYNTLQILAERLDGERLSVGDCQDISRNISAVLDVEDIIDSRYNLEVSSPGVDRPLTQLKDFQKYQGFTARFQLKVGAPLEGTEFVRRKFKADIIEVSDDGIIKLVSEDKHNLQTEFSNIESAKLVLTDALLKAKI